MGFFDQIGGYGGGILGGMAGLPAGIFGVAGGGLLGSKIGQGAQNMAGFGPAAPGPDYSGMSPYPTYVGMDPNGMSLAGGFQSNPNLAKYASESMRTGPSQGTQFALQQNRLGANAGRDQAQKMAAGNAANAASAISMRGGLGAGANERIQKSAGNAALDASNAVDANAGANRASLLTADENARTSNLANSGQMIQGQNAQNYGMAAGDLQRKQGEFDRRNAYNLGLYNTNMAAWGAGKTADATAKSGKK